MKLTIRELRAAREATLSHAEIHSVLRDALKADQFTGVLSLEWDRYWHPYLPELDKALHAAARTRWW